MVIVNENGELRSYGLAPRRNRLFEEAIFHVLGQVLQMRITASPNARVSCSVFPADGIHSLPQPYTRPGPSAPARNSTLPHGPQRPLQLFHGRPVWAFHCHNLYHMAAGMFATLVYRGFG
jgi:hypothetical protein